MCRDQIIFSIFLSEINLKLYDFPQSVSQSIHFFTLVKSFSFALSYFSKLNYPPLQYLHLSSNFLTALIFSQCFHVYEFSTHLCLLPHNTQGLIHYISK